LSVDAHQLHVKNKWSLKERSYVRRESGIVQGERKRLIAVPGGWWSRFSVYYAAP
jgi:hypothetical protein